MERIPNDSYGGEIGQICGTPCRILVFPSEIVRLQRDTGCITHGSPRRVSRAFLFDFLKPRNSWRFLFSATISWRWRQSYCRRWRSNAPLHAKSKT